MFKTLIGEQEKDNLGRCVVPIAAVVIAVVAKVVIMITAVSLTVLDLRLAFATCGTELRYQSIHVFLHLASQGSLNHCEHGGYHDLEVKFRVKAKEVAEDTQGRTHEKIAALLFDELAYLLSPTFKKPR